MKREVLTLSEKIFEEWCQVHNLEFQRIKETTNKTPDYWVKINGCKTFVEIKQIDRDEDFRVGPEPGMSSSTRTPGEHVRKKIDEARGQLKEPSRNGFQTILLIYNNLDGLQLFGTEQHDFLAGMFGQLTMDINIKTKEASGLYYGKNRSLRPDKNTCFSAVGNLWQTREGARIHLYENPHASTKINFDSLPAFIEWNKVEFT